MKTVCIAAASLLALAAVACGHESKPPQSAGPSGITVTSAPTPSAKQDAVAMSDDLRKVCGIEDTGKAPKFDFDSALLSNGDRSELDQLATCMTTGPLKGKKIALVGRADPRGEAEYNMNLGASRASGVRDYLGRLGVDRGRLETTSRGALDAQGHDEATWATDRRVDLRLAGN